MPLSDTRPIALVTPLYAPAVGGVERYVERLATGLVARGVAVEVVTTDPGAREPSVEDRDGVVVRRFPTVRRDATYFASPRLARWLAPNAGRYALLHAHNLHTLVPLAAAYAARRDHLPLVITGHYHGGGHTPLRRALHVPYRPVARRAVRSASHLICNSNAECDLLRRDFGSGLATTLIPEGIELPLPAGDGAGDAGVTGSTVGDGAADPDGRSDAVSILTIGRLEAYKSVERIVGALPLLPKDHRLVIVGEGPARASIEAAAGHLGVSHRVVFRGRVPDAELAGWYARAAASVSLSMHESFGLAVLEAAAAGCPVVASDIPALTEAARFAPRGRIALVPLDAPSELIARAIGEAIGRGRSDAITPGGTTPGWTIPTWDAMVDATLGVYASVLRDSGRTPRPDRPG